MTPEQLHRAALTATAFGQAERYAQLREHFGPHDARSEFEHLEGAAAACLTHRLGPPTTQEGTTGPVNAAKARGRNEIGALMAELRAAGPEHDPPANLLELEAAIRGLRGEPHLTAEIGTERLRTAYRYLIRYLTDTQPDIRNDFNELIRQAREHIMRRLTG